MNELRRHQQAAQHRNAEERQRGIEIPADQTLVDKVLLFCFQYDAKAGSYAPTAIGLMKVAGGVTVFILAIALLPSWLRKRVDKASQREPAPAQDENGEE